MCIWQTSKHSHVSDNLLCSTPCLFWNSVHNSFGCVSILIYAAQLTSFAQYYNVLLRCIPCGKILMNPMLPVEMQEVFGDIFPTYVSYQHFYIVPTLLLNKSFEVVELLKHFTFLFQKIHPHLPCVIIYKCQNTITAS